MNKKSYQYFLRVVALGLMSLPVAAWAQEGETEEEKTVESEIEIGIDVLSDDAYRFGKYTGKTEDGVEPILDFKIESTTKWDSEDTSSWSLQGWRLGLDSRRIEFEYAQQGAYSFSAGYREIPNNLISNGFLPYDGFGSNFYTLPSNWALAPFSNTTSGFLTLDENLKTIDIERKRQRLDLEYSRILNKDWNFSVEYRHEVKSVTATCSDLVSTPPGLKTTRKRLVGKMPLASVLAGQIMLHFPMASARWHWSLTTALSSSGPTVRSQLVIPPASVPLRHSAAWSRMMLSCPIRSTHH
jgi:hypothetical protein